MTVTDSQDHATVPAAILGPGNIGTDLLMKLERIPVIDAVLMTGIYADSPGLARARELGVDTSDRGVDAVLERSDIAVRGARTAVRAR